jgi:3'-phosphoadenosine 5'-phosphosulfate sulfotransferase (PAPS reductase)/FAD synthetase
MASIFSKTISNLQLQADIHDEIIVSYSGGKDSLCVLDMCAKVFRKVVCLFLYFVEDFQYIQPQLKYPQERYGIEVVKYPHWAYINSLRNMEYCDAHPELSKYPPATPIEVYQAAMDEIGIPFLAMGAKKADSLWRKRWYSQISKSPKYSNIIFPILEWHKWDVLAYLKIHNIPIPPDETSKSRANGADLSTNFICWLHDNHPDDFKRLLKRFPYAEAVIYRRQFYGESYRTKLKRNKRPLTS